MIIFRARTPSLMLAAAANATATPAPASHHRFTMPTDGWPFAVSARDSAAIGLRTISLQDTHSGSPCFTALTGVETSSLTLLVLNASFARRQASVAPGAR